MKESTTEHNAKPMGEKEVIQDDVRFADDAAKQLGDVAVETKGTGTETKTKTKTKTETETGTETETKTKSRGGKHRRGLITFLLGLILAPIWLPVLLIVLLYIPAVQDAAVQFATEYASEQTGLDIQIERLRIRYPLDLDLQRFVARDPKAAPEDTLLAVDHFVVDLDLTEVLSWNIGVEAVDLEKGRVDTKDFIESLRLNGQIGNCHLKARQVALNQGQAHVDEAYLDGCDVEVAMRDTTIIDTTTSKPVEWTLTLDDVRLRKTHVRFRSRLDTIKVDARVGEATLANGTVDLAKNKYRYSSLSVDSTTLSYAMPYDDVALDATIGRLKTDETDIDVEANLYRVPTLDVSGTRLKMLMPTLTMGGDIDEMTLRGLLADVEKNKYNFDELRLEQSKIQLDVPDCMLDGDIDELGVSKLLADVGRDGYSLSSLVLKRSKVALYAQGRNIGGDFSQLRFNNLLANTSTELYGIDNVLLDAANLRYDVVSEAVQPGLDVNHIRLQEAYARLDNLTADMKAGVYKGDLSSLRFKERCGFTLNKLSSRFYYDATRLKLTNTELKTPTSHLRGRADILFGTRRNEAPIKHFDAYAEADFSKKDVMLLAQYYIPQTIIDHYPERILTLGVDVSGTLDDVRVNKAYLKMPNLVEATLTGKGRNLADMDRMTADVGFDIRTYDLSLVKHLAQLDESIDLPPMQLEGDAQIDRQLYAVDARLKQGQGVAHVKGHYNGASESYTADIDTKSLPLRAFLTTLPLSPLTAKAHVEGQGVDPYSAATTMTGDFKVSEFKYSIYNLAGIGGEASLKNTLAKAHLHSGSSILDMDAHATTHLTQPLSKADFDLDLRHIDLRALGLVDYPLAASMQSHIEGASNLKDVHWAEGRMSDLSLTYRDTTYTHSELDFNAYVNADSIRGYVQTGDLLARASVKGSLDGVVSQFEKTLTNITSQIKDYRLDQEEFKKYLPTLTAHIESGRENVVYEYLCGQGYAFDDFYFDLQCDPRTGVNGYGEVKAFMKDSTLIDGISVQIGQDTTGVTFDAHAFNTPENPNFTFDGRFKGSLATTGASGLFTWIDDQGKTWFNVGLKGVITREGKRLSIYPHDPILAYRKFKVNKDNYIYMGKDRRVEADVDLLADDDTGLKLYSTENADSTVIQDLTLGLNHFNIGELCQVVRSLPDAAGFLSGDIHLVQTPEEKSFMCDVSVQDMMYEGTKMGKIGINAVYLPNDDGSQYVNGLFIRNDLNIADVEGTYYPAEPEGTVDVKAHLLDLPANLADAFAGGMMRFAGTVGGDLGLYGPLSGLSIDGNLTTDSVRVISDEYSLNLRVQDDSIQVARNQLHFNDLKIYSSGRNPLTMNGDVDFRKFDNIKLQLMAQARNFELINAGRTRGASAYGKAYVDLAARIQGTPEDITIGGKIDVLNTTNLTYVLKDSPLSNNDDLSDIVTFVNFKDSTAVAEEEKAKPMNLSMTMLVNINEAARVNCMLSEDRSNYVNVTGGGDLTLSYDPRDGMQLFGRYTIHEGDIKYSMLVVPLKNFSIANDSYVEFQGEIANPYLNIAATERLTTTITENQSPRSVAFDVGLKVTQTLEKMGLAFTIDAPDDLGIQNELASMTDEQKGRVAVTMLATGMYINEQSTNGSSGGLSASNALNAFLQSQISSLSSKALKSVDLSVGMENGISSVGTTTTDYSFRFAKRFWNNRISVIIGGKVSTGNQAENSGQSIINNVSLEYRLDDGATRYVKLFYDKDYNTMLDGDVTKMGAGLVLRRKTERLGELFMFRNRKKQILYPTARPPQPAPQKADSTMAPQDALPPDTTRVQ